MKRLSLLLLLCTTIFFGATVLIFCVFALPFLAEMAAMSFTGSAVFQIFFYFTMSITAVPLLFGLFQTIKFLDLVDKNNTFTDTAISILKKVKICALLTSVLCMINLPIVYLMAITEDAPGIMLIGLFFTGIPVVIAAFLHVLQGIFQEVIDKNHIPVGN